MRMPDGFQFSQASLQAYVDCPRLFELRYLLRIAWPAIEGGAALEQERRRLAGLAFHRLIFRETVGVPRGLLASTIADNDLARWWANYLSTPPPNLPQQRYAEISLSAPLLDHRVIAKYDLLAVEPAARAVIVDWKTYRTRPDRLKLAARLQTRVYAYLLARAGHELNGGQPPRPDQIEMTYWFADFAADLERFAYTEAQYLADEAYLTTLVTAITELAAGEYPMTERQARCTYCQYGPLCDRGTGLGSVDNSVDGLEGAEDAALDLSFDFEQIAEIEY